MDISIVIVLLFDCANFRQYELHSMGFGGCDVDGNNLSFLFDFCSWICISFCELDR